MKNLLLLNFLLSISLFAQTTKVEYVDSEIGRWVFEYIIVFEDCGIIKMNGEVRETKEGMIFSSTPILNSCSGIAVRGDTKIPLKRYRCYDCTAFIHTDSKNRDLLINFEKDYSNIKEMIYFDKEAEVYNFTEQKLQVPKEYVFINKIVEVSMGELDTPSGTGTKITLIQTTTGKEYIIRSEDYYKEEVINVDYHNISEIKDREDGEVLHSEQSKRVIILKQSIPVHQKYLEEIN